MVMTTVTLTRPDDWHCHLRDDSALATTVPHTAARFGRAIVMPNLNPPVTTVAMAEAYAQRILAAVPAGHNFTPLMTLYLTDAMQGDEISRAADSPWLHACKLYPAGATTNSASGVSQIANISRVLEAMQQHQLPLLVHGEVTDPDVDVFDREQVFIDRHLIPLCRDFPELRIVLEHITTREAVDFVTAAGPNIAATITPQHLLLNRNAMLVGGIQPHHYCLPVLKRELHRQALLQAAISANPKFFLGTDSAPHEQQRKENACGCAGIYSAHAAIEFYTEIFATADALDRLEGFASFFGADFYRLPRNKQTITLTRQAWTIPGYYAYSDNGRLIPFQANKPLNWRLASSSSR